MRGFRKRAVSVAVLTEQETCLRFSIVCNKLLQLYQFRTDKHKYTCISHLHASRRKEVLGSHEKLAFNSLYCRACRMSQKWVGL
jgi:hypothetical protein